MHPQQITSHGQHPAGLGWAEMGEERDRAAASRGRTVVAKHADQSGYIKGFAPYPEHTVLSIRISLQITHCSNKKNFFFFFLQLLSIHYCDSDYTNNVITHTSLKAYFNIV